MVKNKIYKILISIIISIMMITIIGKTITLAEVKTEDIDLALSGVRVIKNGTSFDSSSTRAYALNTGSNHQIYQIVSLKKNGGQTVTSGTNFLCVNATVGNTWNNNSVGTAVTYDTSYDLVSDKSAIQSLRTEYKNVVGDKYTQVMWLLDHFLLGTDYSNDDIDELLEKAGIVYEDKGGSFAGAPLGKTYYFDETKIKAINSSSAFADTDSDLYKQLYGNSAGKGGYYYADQNGAKKDVRLTKELIETVEQAAVWYFTNYKTGNNSEYNCYTSSGVSASTIDGLNEDQQTYDGANAVVPKYWLRYKDGNTWKLLANETVTGNDSGTEVTGHKGAMLQEQASILYNYFIDAANKAANDGYTSQTKGTIKLEYTGSNTDQKIVEEGNNYKVGPLKITVTGNTTISGVTVTTGTSETALSGVTLKNSSGTTITKPTKGQEFYVIVPKSAVNGKINVKATANTNAVEKKLRIVKDKLEQPVVEVTPSNEKIEDKIEIPLNKQFDLALRKTIVKIMSNGTEKSILNEKGLSAERKITVLPETIPDTATYQHRKDPVVISTGDIVTYRISIYNEGEIDGYASKIVDQLPKGVESVLKKDGTVTSHEGNVYKVTAYDTTTNKLELSIDKTKTVKSIGAFDGTTVKNDYIEIDCKVTGTPKTDGKTKQYLTNIAYIAEEYDKDGNKIDADRDGTESKPTTYPNKTAEQLNNSDADNYKGSSDKSVYHDTNNKYYYEGQEDDDDFEKIVLLPKEFDLALRKFITKINDKNITDREPNITASEVGKLKDGDATYDNGTTAAKKHSKDKLKVKIGDTVIYTIRIYNEGEIDGYASEVTDYLPQGLSLKENSTINEQYGWTKVNDNEIKTNYLADKLIEAMNSSSTNIAYEDLQIECVINDNATAKNLKNIAEITEDKDKDENDVEDRDSKPDNVNKDDYNPKNPENGKGEQDDDDFEDLELAKFDLALRKFITKISRDGNFESSKTTTTYNRAPEVDTSKLKAGTADTAIYNHSKEPISLYAGDYILYTLRAYNEGDIDGYASEITDYLPENLDFVDSTDTYTKSINDKWTYDSKTRKVTTTTNTLLKAFDSKNDDGKGSKLSYTDVQIICKVNNNVAVNKKLTNIAEISQYKDEDGKVVEKDRDSSSDNLKYPDEPSTYKDSEISKKYVPGQEDDDDFEKVIIKENPKFDLALRKFITTISGKDTTSRIPKVSYENGKIKYEHSKDVLRTTVNDTVIYTLRVFNEGDIAGYAEEITDDIPEYLEYLPEHTTNREYKWVMYDKDGKSTTKVSDAVKIKTDYTSKANGELLMKSNTKLKENPNLLNAFDKNAKISDTNPDYVDVKVAFKVKDPKSNKTVIVNKAQISEDADENGNPVDDIDSIPDKWNEGEDDQDYENVAVDYFDLSLLKYVTKAIVTENGKTKVTKTGNNGSSKDITPKVEVYRKSLNKTIVKFEFTIKITNEGDIAGYAREITDYVPKGLKFYKEDNKGWKDEGNNVISTELLKNTLLKPGQSATVKVILRWINGENNLGLKTNVAEISKDYNEKGVPDRDSTPDNKKKGEDDIDDAPVLLTISTGILEHTIQYVVGALVILIVLGTGLVVIKKYVL